MGNVAGFPDQPAIVNYSDLICHYVAIFREVSHSFPEMNPEYFGIILNIGCDWTDNG